jgi:hypothetical protein
MASDILPVCPGCGKTCHRPDQVYCSRQCRSETLISLRPKCPVCNEQTPSGRKFCSLACAKVAQSTAERVLRQCGGCGKDILISVNDIPKNRDGSVCSQSFCDRSCYDLSRTKAREQRTAECENCRKPFIVEGGTNAKYCSWDCRLQHRRGKPVNCLMCGCFFTPVKKIKRGLEDSWISYNPKDGRATCSPSCHIQWIKTNPERKEKISAALKGELHHNWKGGRKWLNDASFRGRGWKGIAERARARDGFECKRCGMTQAENISRSGRALDVHHIVPFHNWPNSTMANKMSNLISLCASCHKIEEANVPEVQMTLMFSDHRSGQRSGHKKGDKHYCAKLSEPDVRKIREMFSNGRTLQSLADEFGVGATNISAIVNRKTWKHIP